MANIGKFIDRSPIICAAGKSTGLSKETVATTLTEYSLEDKVTAIKHDAHIWNEDVFVPPRQLPPIQNRSFCGTNTQVREVVNPPVTTRYQELIGNLKETTYGSFWKAELGKSRDWVPGLPAGMNPEEVTFGSIPVKGVTVKELISPPKTRYEVLWESQVAHDWYKKTHNDYNPSERIHRGYNEHFDPKKRFGYKSKYDPRGIWARCGLNWYNTEPILQASKTQADFIDKTRPQLGKVLAPNNNISCVPKDHRFGEKTPRPYYGVPELLKDPDVAPCLFKNDFYTWLGSLNKLKMAMKERTNTDFDFDDFYKRSLYFDKEKTGWLPISLFYELCACHRITFHKNHIESLLKVIGIITEDRINYKKFIELVNIHEEPFDMIQFNDIPNENKYYLSTTQAANCDHLIMDNSGMPPAGVPSIRFDLQRPVVPAGGTRADLDHLGDYTSANALINPSIYTNYGLTYRDFFMPRSPETIRTLFEKVGYNFPGESFEKLWKAGVDIDKTGSVCIDTFKALLQSQCPPPKLAVDEQECEKY